MHEPLSCALTLRRVAEVTRVPALARPLLRREAGKPKGWARVGQKLGKGLFRVHQRLGLPARGRIVIDPDGTPRPFAADFTNTGYLDFTNRKGGYEPEVSALLQCLAPHAHVVYDIGANWGYFSALMATAPGFQGRIEAFEIAPRTHRDLAALLKATGLQTTVRAHALGLSDHAGTIAIAEGLHSFLTHVSADGRGRRVPVAPLDSLDLPDPDLVKMDVEGHEAAVLRGGAARLGRAKPLVVFENWWDPARTAAMTAPLQVFAGLGYHFMRLRWTPMAGAAGRLDLIPLSIEARREIPEALNLLAVHPVRASALRNNMTIL